jgi:HD-like signal output (HDOD) protein
MQLTQKLKIMFGMRAEAPVPQAPGEESSGSRPLPGVAPFVPESTPPPPVEAVTITDVLKAKIDELGGPSQDVEPDAWMSVADAVRSQAHAEPRPPSSFPIVATRIMAMMRNPTLDIADLVTEVQRDAAISATVIRVANSAMYSPPVAITNLRGALQLVGMQEVTKIVLGGAGRSMYDIPSKHEMAVYPNLWKDAFHDAVANAFTAARMALDVPGANAQHALLAGLLVDVGRPITLRVITRHFENDVRPDEATVAAALDEIAGEVSTTTIAALALPTDLQRACGVGEAVAAEARLARLVSAIGAIQRRSPRCWRSAFDVRTHADAVQLSPDLVRTLFATRAQYRHQTTQIFS